MHKQHSSPGRAPATETHGQVYDVVMAYGRVLCRAQARQTYVVLSTEILQPRQATTQNTHD